MRFDASTTRPGRAAAPNRYAKLSGLALALALSACHAPVVKPDATAPLDRQVAALKALGFTATDEGWQLNLPDPISFAFGKTSVKQDERRIVARTAAELRALRIERLRIEGHSDNVGPTAVNLDLSQRRADAVAGLFVESGFEERNVARAGFGASLPIAGNDTRDGRARNRRVEIIVPADALAGAP